MAEVILKSFLKKTRGGKILRLNHEEYLRDDIQCGTLHSKVLSSTELQRQVAASPHRQLLIVDTNVAMHQADFLEYDCPAVSFVVLTQTMLQELRNLNLSVYKRILGLLQKRTRNFILFPNQFCSSTAVNRYFFFIR
jgi:exosome complex exonuclease DIS3/RRP44